MHALRLAAAAAVLAAALALPGAGADPGPEPCPARLCAAVGHPTPGARVVLHEDPGCATHRAVWQGAWMSLADAARWSWSDRSAEGARALDDRAAAEALGAMATGVGLAAEALGRGPDFAADPFAALAWAWAAPGDEDLCLLGLVEVTTGLSGP